MITEIQDHEQKEILKLLSFDKYQNPYLYIDTITFGFVNGKIRTWVIKDENIKGVIYQYHNSLQLFECDAFSEDDYSKLARFVMDGKYEMATGKEDIINGLQKYLQDEYISAIGVIMGADIKIQKPIDCNISIATIEDLSHASMLVCSDGNIGGHYSVEQLTSQYTDRMMNSGCINVVYKINNTIVGHAATYADMQSFAIIGGIISSPNYRGEGIASKLTKYITSLVQEQNKLPLIYCYEPYLYGWYEHLGFKIITNCGKLEKIR